MIPDCLSCKHFLADDTPLENGPVGFCNAMERYVWDFNARNCDGFAMVKKETA